MAMTREKFVCPDWAAPTNVVAVTTTRCGGISKSPFDGFNLAFHVEDNAADVLQNRARLKDLLEFQNEPQWLNQVHGVNVAEAMPNGLEQEADAVFTDQLNLPCAVLTADCLPVFFCNQEGTQVAVAHAGWRGLVAGILEATLDKFAYANSHILAWLGPAIGPEKFEVGSEVRDIFIKCSSAAESAFRPNKANPGHWFADLYQLARIRLAESGVREVSGGNFCTYSESERFYSYRRDGQTGRMASLIWLKNS